MSVLSNTRGECHCVQERATLRGGVRKHRPTTWAAFSSRNSSPPDGADEQGHAPLASCGRGDLSAASGSPHGQRPPDPRQPCTARRPAAGCCCGSLITDLLFNVITHADKIFLPVMMRYLPELELVPMRTQSIAQRVLALTMAPLSAGRRLCRPATSF